MVAAENNGEFSAAHDLVNFNGYLFASSANLMQVVGLASELTSGLWAHYRHVAKITYLITELCDALINSRDTKRSRPYVHARQTRTETEWHTQDANAPPHPRVIRR